MPRQILVKFAFLGGYQSDIPATNSSDALRQGSRNVLVTGSGLLKPFKGLTEVASTKATGSITVASKVALTGKTITINGITFTFETATNTGANIQFDAGDTLAQIATKIATKLNAYADPIDDATYTPVGDVVNIQFDVASASGNAFTLVSATAGTRMVMSGATLTGGTTAPEGSRVNYLTDNGYAGLGDADAPGAGSVAKQIDLMFFIGTGLLKINGTQITIDSDDVEATSNWQYLTRNAGTFNNNSELFQVGHPQPDRPAIFAKSPPSAGQKVMNAAVTVCIWRADSNTGQPSLPSPASEILEVRNGSVIVTFPDADDNGNDLWGIGVTLPGLADLGNMYQLQSELGGEVLESTLAYTRTIEGSISVDETTLTSPDANFTNSDIGRRIRRNDDGLDTWIISVTADDEVELNDAAGTGITSQAFVITQAVDGIERAVEVSWADTDLIGQPFAPFDGFEPPDGAFAGNLMDTFYIEDLEGTIFYSIPNYFSFPRSRRIFTEDRATVYVDTGYGYHWRIAKQSIAQIFYAVGERPIQAMLKSKNAGCKYPQNACLGHGGRLLAWTGRPTMVDSDGQMNAQFHMNVASEFDGWEDQTVDQPVVTAYDPIGLYELWCYGNKILPIHAPTGRWCAPILIDDWVEDATVVGQVIVNERLRLVIRVDDELVHYEWNVGAGSFMVIESYFRETPEHQTTITLVNSIVKPGTTTSNFRYSIIKNFTDTIELGTSEIPNTPYTQIARNFRKNVRGVEEFAIKIEGFGATLEEPIDGNAAVDTVTCWGEWSQEVR